jgi:PKD repeat protein/predicted MPP superfamily phosphohydrolase
LRYPLDRDTDTKDDFIESEPTIGKNQPPIPIIKFSPKNPVKGVKVKFDASSSTDPDGKILNFEWQIGTSTFSGTTTEFTFNENGDYEIILTATDNEGATSSASTIIKISPFSFAIITDLHIGRGYPDYDSSGFEDSDEGEDYYLTERLKNVVQWIIDNRDNVQCENATCSIKFLVVLGDIADSGEKSEFLKAKKILGRLNEYGIPYVPVFGNHDVWPYTDFDEATTSLGENYFDEIFWSENATNTKLMKEILGFKRDESNKNYKNFAFSLGGINFIGLDFNSREKTKEGGVKGEAVNHSETINWLKEKLNEFGRKESVIILSHEPFAEPNSRILYKIAGEEILFPLPQGNFSEKELAEIKKILKDYESKSEGQQILVNSGGHIHGFEKLGKEIKFFGQFSPIDLYFDANWQYPSLSTVPVLTTEALMVGGNEENLSNKGLVRIVKINNKENIDFSEIEAKFPALNPYITFEYKILPDQVYPCVFFKAHLFSEREYTILWDFGDGKTGTGVIETHCYSPLQVPQTYSIKLTATDKKTNNKEDITRKVMIKEGIIPKVIKIAEKTKEKVELISNELGEKVTEFGRTMRDWVEIRVKHSPSTPVGMINVHFERASNDINLTNLTVDVDLEKKKSLLYVPEWPEIIEENKVLFIPK